MDKYQGMKLFKNIYQDCCRNKADLNSLQGPLQILSVADDISIFDPVSIEATEFYINLRELMLKLESSSPLMWCAVGVLQQACQNSAARGALIHIYKFTPMLSKLLETSIILDKKLRVLALLEQLTYGIRISWQEAHLPALLATLAQWVQGDEKELIRLSLGVLVNLLHKNLPAIYTLLRSIDYEQFLRNIYANKNFDIKVHISKLIIILESFSGPIPDEDILHFVDVTLKKIGDAFIGRDIFLMRHIVDFFDDVRGKKHSQKVLLRYTSYSTDIQRLLSLIDVNSEPECVGMMFELLNSLLLIGVPGLSQHYKQIVSTALCWTRTDLACTHSLLLVRTVAAISETDQEVSRSVMKQLEQGFEVLLLALDAGDAPSMESRARLTALVQLLQQMCADEVMLAKILDMLQPGVMRQIFQPLVSAEITVGNNLFDKESFELYIYTLSFLATLAHHGITWLELYAGLVREKQVQMILASSLYSGSQIVKEKLLFMLGSAGFPTECLTLLSEALCKLEPVVMSTLSATGNSNSDTISRQYAQDLAPLFSLSREHRLDDFIERMSEALENNQINDVTTCAVMELYQYKLTALEHAERAMLSSLEAATNHSTSLLQQLAQMKGELSRMHQLMHCGQQQLETLQKEKLSLISSLNDNELSMIKSKEKSQRELKACKQSLVASEELVIHLKSAVDDYQADIRATKEALTEVSRELVTANEERAKHEKHIADLNRFCDEAKQTNLILDERITKRDESLRDKEQALHQSVKSEKALKRENLDMKTRLKAQEANLSQKDAELKSTREELQKLQRFKEAIVEMSIRSDTKIA